MQQNKTSTLKLNASISPGDYTEQIQWISNNENVAKVDQNGLVTAVGPGSTVITVCNSDHTIYADCNISVNWDRIIFDTQRKIFKISETRNMGVYSS